MVAFSTARKWICCLVPPSVCGVNIFPVRLMVFSGFPLTVQIMLINFLNPQLRYFFIF